MDELQKTTFNPARPLERQERGQSYIDMGLDRQEAVLNALSAAIDRLNDRLLPVIRPNIQGSDSPVGDPPDMSPLAVAVNIRADKMDVLLYRLNVLYDSIELP